MRAWDRLGQGKFSPSEYRASKSRRIPHPTGFCFGGATFRPMNRAQLDEHVAKIDRHIAEVKAHITRQRAIVKRLNVAAHSELSETTLLRFEDSHGIFEKYRELILDQFKQP